MKPGRVIFNHASGGFTLLEILVATAAAALVLVCVYGLFAGAMRMKERAAAQNKDVRMHARALNILRSDLNGAMISGGILASSLQGDTTSTAGGSSFPGYLKFTTTTGKDTTQEQYGDVQQVEYYIVPDTTGTITNGGTLVRVITRDLLNAQSGTPSVTHQENILDGVQSFQVSFFDGQAWQPTWTITGSNNASSSGTSTTAAATSSGTATSGSNSATPALPEAIRVDIQLAGNTPYAVNGPNAAGTLPAPLEILVPWTTVPYLSGTNFTVGSDTAQ